LISDISQKPHGFVVADGMKGVKKQVEKLVMTGSGWSQICHDIEEDLSESGSSVSILHGRSLDGEM
jgi:hypothetical protein